MNQPNAALLRFALLLTQLVAIVMAVRLDLTVVACAFAAAMALNTIALVRSLIERSTDR